MRRSCKQKRGSSCFSVILLHYKNLVTVTWLLFPFPFIVKIIAGRLGQGVSEKPEELYSLSKAKMQVLSRPMCLTVPGQAEIWPPSSKNCPVCTKQASWLPQKPLQMTVQRWYITEPELLFSTRRGMDKIFGLFVSQQFLMILLKNLFYWSWPFNSAREENMVQYTGIICSCSHHSSTGWHPRPPLMGSSSAPAESPPVVSASCIPSCSCRDTPGSCGFQKKGSNSPVTELRIPGTTVRESLLLTGLLLHCPESKAANNLHQAEVMGTSSFFQHQTVFRSVCGGGIPLAPPEGDLCHFYQDLTHASNAEHMWLARSKGSCQKEQAE